MWKVEELMQKVIKRSVSEMVLIQKVDGLILLEMLHTVKVKKLRHMDRALMLKDIRVLLGMIILMLKARIQQHLATLLMQKVFIQQPILTLNMSKANIIY